MLRNRTHFLFSASLVAVALCVSGCTSLGDYLRNGFKVGPDYGQPGAPVAAHWIDAADRRVSSEPADLSHWWTVYNDPVLNDLIYDASQQNLTLEAAGFRILQARSQLAIARGDLFPQQQSVSGSYNRVAIGANPPAAPGVTTRYQDQWDLGFNLNWELDFWGRFRRAVAAQDDLLQASIEDYDDVLVTLLGDVASNYVSLRTNQTRIALLKANVELQQGVLKFVEDRAKAGFRVSDLDVEQARSNLAQVQAAIPQLETNVRIANNRLCILLGLPPEDLDQRLGVGPIPNTPTSVTVGIPADLLSRRPDVRRAQFETAALAEQIGIADAELYPFISINGNIDYRARSPGRLFTNEAFGGSVGPSFQWNVLNYGRIINNVKLQEARFQESISLYQNTVLAANEEVENGLAVFLNTQERAQMLDVSVTASQKAVAIVVAQLEKGAVDFNRYAVIAQSLVQQQDLQAQAHGDIAQGLIQIYRALGGGWEIRLGPPGATFEGLPPGAVEQMPPGAAAGMPPAEAVPAPQAQPMPLLPQPQPQPAVPQLNPAQPQLAPPQR